jgi:hypothetical protein
MKEIQEWTGRDLVDSTAFIVACRFEVAFCIDELGKSLQWVNT